MSQFMLSRDTDWSDLMQFISDNRKTFDYSRKDLNTISKNECFGLVALQVKEYLEDEGLSLDDIDLSHYSNDKRKNALEDVVARAFRTYLSGECMIFIIKCNALRAMLAGQLLAAVRILAILRFPAFLQICSFLRPKPWLKSSLWMKGLTEFIRPKRQWS